MRKKSIHLIFNFPDYLVNEQGGVYSRKWGKLRKLKPGINSGGRYIVSLCRGGKKYTQEVGRLVLETFIGPRPKGMEMCHGSKGRLNNSLNNLCWGTRSKNMGEDKVRDGTDVRGEKHCNNKLTRKQILAIRSSRTTQVATAKKLGVSEGTISKIIHRKSWSWLK